MQKQSSYILFIDESGKTRISDDGSHFLLTGLVINKDLHSALSSYMISLKEKSNIPTDENIHAFDLFEAERRRRGRTGGAKHERIPYTKLDVFFSRLIYLIEGADVHSFVFTVDKTFLRDKILKCAGSKRTTEKAVLSFIKRKRLHDVLYEALSRKMILEFAHFLETHDAHGEIIAESRRDADHTVLDAFMAATNSNVFDGASRYQGWAKSGFERIHGLTFETKKGLSFGLEIADLFAWAYFNHEYGSTFPVTSKAKGKRVKGRIDSVCRALDGTCLKKPEEITKTKLKTLAADRVSEFTDALGEFVP
jgi:hypothetical protein